MILVLCPSRGRPLRATATFHSFIATKEIPSTSMLFVIDPDDPARDEYQALPTLVASGNGNGMGAPLNEAAARLVDSTEILGFVGDDHLFRTVGWDNKVWRALKRGGIAYGDDLARPELPTQVFISSAIVKALGWMCLPGAHHLYLDNTWAELGARAECLHFLDDVVIEHMHPEYGKAERDEGYQRVNSASVYSHDGSLFAHWRDTQADKDAATVRGVLDSL